jgi:hypothetical protein
MTDKPSKLPKLLSLGAISRALQRYAYRFKDEAQLHEGLARALSREGFDFAHEYKLDQDRFDFFQEHTGIVIEAKIKGTASEALRQAERYCQQPKVSGVLLVTTKHWGIRKTLTFNKKPVEIITLKGQSF